jgi:hypothetical protein
LLTALWQEPHAPTTISARQAKLRESGKGGDMSLIRKLAYFRAIRAMTRIPANLPHLAVGGFVTYAGFVLSKRHGETA